MILDADMAVRPEELPKFLKPLQNGTADFVNGSRLVYPMHGRAMKFANFLGNKAFCFLVSWIVRQRVSDTLCGTKALLRQDYLRMPRVGGTLGSFRPPLRAATRLREWIGPLSRAAWRLQDASDARGLAFLRMAWVADLFPEPCRGRKPPRSRGANDPRGPLSYGSSGLASAQVARRPGTTRHGRW
jgi:hypothetical protein